jgi:hypothetical protein
MLQRLKLYLLIAAVVVLAVLAGYYYFLAAKAGAFHQTYTSAAVVQQILPLQELVTVRYNIQKVVGLKEEKVPFGSESVLLLVQATVLGGVDLATLTAAQVQVTPDRHLNITLPAPKVLHVYINDQETRVWDRSKTWWTPWVAANPQLEQNARQLALEAMQQAALEMGLLTNAQHNAETTLRRFLQLAGYPIVAFTGPSESIR